MFVCSNPRATDFFFIFVPQRKFETDNDVIRLATLVSYFQQRMQLSRNLKNIPSKSSLFSLPNNSYSTWKPRVGKQYGQLFHWILCKIC